MANDELILVIEPGVDGGSISLLKDFTEIGYWHGKTEVSKSEDVLAEVNRLLKKYNQKKTQIKKIVVSDVLGSSTGIRIGQAIGLGLSKALDCKLEIMSVLKAMASTLFLSVEVLNRRDRIIAVVPFGRNRVYWQGFYQKNSGNIVGSEMPEFYYFEDFVEFYNKINFRCYLIMQQKLFEEFCLKDISSNENISLYDAGNNLAALVGKASFLKELS